MWLPHRDCHLSAPGGSPIPASHTVSVCFSQSESEEKVVTYDHIGPNVCMGDHKVSDLAVTRGGAWGWLHGGGLAASCRPCRSLLASQKRPSFLFSFNFNKILGGSWVGREAETTSHNGIKYTISLFVKSTVYS